MTANPRKPSGAQVSRQVGMLLGVVQTLRLAWRLFWDRRVAIKPKLIWVATWAYVISPIDLLPAGLVGPLGLADDLIALVAGTGFFIQSCPPDIVEEHRHTLFDRPAGPDEE